MGSLVPSEVIEKHILIIRSQKVMLDRDLAFLYGVETRVLNQAVRRNIERFPEDFMFQLTKEEMDNWKSQIVISNKEKMGLRRRPYAFTENGVAMLSSVLNSSKAIQVNIQRPVAQIDLTPENCFAPCSLRITYPCSDSVPLDARTCRWASDSGHRP